MMLAGIFVFLFGLIVGSFLNVVIFRLEKGEHVGGRSYCPHCKHQLKWLDLVPVFSFLWLGAKCRYCKQKISGQYPIVEISTALIFLLIFNLRLSPPELSIFYFLFSIFLFYIASSLIVIFVYDLKHFIIPDKILIPAIIITFFYRLLPPQIEHFLDFGGYLLAALVASGFFLAIFLVSKGAWIGFGDVKLGLLMGFLLGFPNIVVALFLAFFLGAIIGIGLMLLSKKGLKSEIPFAPFLIAGTGLAFFFGNNIIAWYMGFFIIQ